MNRYLDILYTKGDYVKLREIINNINWNEAKDFNVDKYWEFMSNNIVLLWINVYLCLNQG